jgi:hypothetical protein
MFFKTQLLFLILEASSTEDQACLVQKLESGKVKSKSCESKNVKTLCQRQKKESDDFGKTT